MTGCAGTSRNAVHPADDTVETVAPETDAGGHTVGPEPAKLKGLTVWALDLEGKQATETLFHSDELLTPLVATSPDGRYFLLKHSMGEHDDRYLAVPMLLDRDTGELATGSEVNMKFGEWSGNGFWIDHLVHLGLDMTISTPPDLASALGATDERTVRSVSLPVGAGKVAALEDPPAIMIDTDNPGEEHWVSIPVPANVMTSNTVTWSPNSEHLLVGGHGVVDLKGDLVLPVDEYHALWSPDGKSIVTVAGVNRTLTVKSLDGHVRELPSPGRWPVGFLPDGRLVAFSIDVGY